MIILQDKATGSQLCSKETAAGQTHYAVHICYAGYWFARDFFADSDAAVDFYYDALAAGADFFKPQGYGF